MFKIQVAANAYSKSILLKKFKHVWEQVVAMEFQMEQHMFINVQKMCLVPHVLAVITLHHPHQQPTIQAFAQPHTPQQIIRNFITMLLTDYKRHPQNFTPCSACWLCASWPLFNDLDPFRIYLNLLMIIIYC